MKTSKICLSLAIAVGMTGLTAPSFAQAVCNSCSTERDIAMFLNSRAAQPPAFQGHNHATVVQSGHDNSATSNVTVPAGVGTGSYFGNVTIQMQVGDGNSSSLRAVGNMNALTTQQTGTNNNAAITVYGNNNVVSNQQTGSGLSYTLQRVGNGSHISVSQRN